MPNIPTQADEVLATDGRTVQEWLDDFNAALHDLLATEADDTLTTETGDALELE